MLHFPASAFCDYSRIADDKLKTSVLPFPQGGDRRRRAGDSPALYKTEHV
jgi:hypothetical protein